MLGLQHKQRELCSRSPSLFFDLRYRVVLLALISTNIQDMAQNQTQRCIEADTIVWIFTYFKLSEISLDRHITLQLSYFWYLCSYVQPKTKSSNTPPSTTLPAKALLLCRCLAVSQPRFFILFLMLFSVLWGSQGVFHSWQRKTTTEELGLKRQWEVLTASVRQRAGYGFSTNNRK